jgi:hypothetical protein
MPSAGEKPFFAYFFLAPAKKVWRRTGRDPSILTQNQAKIITDIAGSGRQPGGFLYWSKESHQRKDRFGAALGICACRPTVILVMEGIIFAAALRGNATKGGPFIVAPPR